MSRRALEIGEAGPVVTTPLMKVGNAWRRAPSARSAQSWRARIEFRGNDGVRGDVSVRRATRKQAEADAVAKVAARLSAGTSEIVATTPLTAVAEQWLAHAKRPGSRLSERSVTLYEQTYRRYIDAPGSTVRGLTVAQANSVPRLRGFLQGIADRHGAGAADTTKVVLSHVLRWALENGREAIVHNAARNFSTPTPCVPRESKRDRTRALRLEEQEAVLGYADKLARDETLDPRAVRKAEATADLLAFMAGTGTRISEARLVRWEHIDLDGGFVRLHGTKSRASKRRLDLPASLLERLRARIDTLRAHHQHAAEYPRPLGNETRPEAAARIRDAAELLGKSGFVFASPGLLDPEKAWQSSNAAKAVRRVLDDAGFEWAVGHTFRRTVATRLGAAGVPVRRIADQLGHTDANTTLRVYLAQDFDGDKSDLAALL